jgi:Family of unknown function (DUF6157)
MSFTSCHFHSFRLVGDLRPWTPLLLLYSGSVTYLTRVVGGALVSFWAGMNYFETLIAVADDCPVASGMEPPSGFGERTVAQLQFELLAAHPHELTQEDVLFETWLWEHEELPDDLPEADRERLRQDFFSRPQACLRSSPLPKRYGWGLLFDAEGRVALCAMESEEYRRMASRADGEVRVLRALRSGKA